VCDICGCPNPSRYDVARMEAEYTPSVMQIDLCLDCATRLVKGQFGALSDKQFLKRCEKKLRVVGDQT